MPARTSLWADTPCPTALAEEVQQETGNSVELTFVDQGYTGPNDLADGLHE